MERVVFYNVVQHDLSKMVCRIVEKYFLAKEGNIFLHCGNQAAQDAINDQLWTFSKKAFIPHDINTCSEAQEYPILLGLDYRTPNDAQICIHMLDQDYPPNVDELERFRICAVVFSDLVEEQRMMARRLYKYYNASKPVKYFEYHDEWVAK